MTAVKKPARKKVVRQPKATDHPSKLRHYMFAQKFVELNFNQTQAYLAVYGEEYKAVHGKEMSAKFAKTSASRLSTNVNVQQYVEQITEQAFKACQISINKVLTRYDRWADADITDVVEWENSDYEDEHGNKRKCFNLSLRDMDNMPKEVRDCIESVSRNQDGFKVTLVSKLNANNMLFKYLGLDKSENNNAPDIHIHFDKDDEALR